MCHRLNIDGRETKPSSSTQLVTWFHPLYRSQSAGLAPITVRLDGIASLSTAVTLCRLCSVELEKDKVHTKVVEEAAGRTDERTDGHHADRQAGIES